MALTLFGTACATSSAPPARATDTINRAEQTATSIVRIAQAQASATIIVGEAHTQVAEEFPSATPQQPTNTPTVVPPTNTPTPEPTETTIEEPTADNATGNAENGELLFNTFQASTGFACATCHLVDSENTLIGPGLLNVAMRAETRVDGQSATDYLYTSIVEPSAYVVEGQPDGLMPQTWAQIYDEDEINDLVAYLMTLVE